MDLNKDVNTYVLKILYLSGDEAGRGMVNFRSFVSDMFLDVQNSKTRVNSPEQGYPAPLILNFGPKSTFFNIFPKESIIFLMTWAENWFVHIAATRRI